VVLFGLLVVGALLLSRPPDPDRARKEIRDRVERELPYVFEGHEPLPGPFRWVVGDAGLPQANPAEGCFTVQMWGDPGLLELVADPWCERYRFSAEVRHEAGMGNSLPGIYFGYREHRTPQGDWQNSFFALTFADQGLVPISQRGHNGEFLSRVLMECFLCKTRAGRLEPASTHVGQSKEFRPALPGAGQLAPWRRLEVEVTPEGVKAYWGLTPEGRDLVAEVPTAGLVEKMAFVKKLNPGFAGLPAELHPRSGLGLYVHKGKVSFRRIVLQPLAGRR